MVVVGQQALRRDFGAWFHGTEVLGKVAHHAQPLRPTSEVSRAPGVKPLDIRNRSAGHAAYLVFLFGGYRRNRWPVLSQQ